MPSDFTMSLLRAAARGRPLTKEQTAHLLNAGFIAMDEDGVITITTQGTAALLTDSGRTLR